MKNKSLIHKLLFVLSFAILFSSGHIENVDTHLRLTQARFLVENGSLEVKRGFGEKSHGNLAVNKKGQQFSVYNPGQIFLFVPIYFLARYLVEDYADSYYCAAFWASFLGYFFYGIIIIIFWKFGKKLNIEARKRFFITILFAFTSYCFAHAQDSYEHIYEAMFLILSIYLLFPLYPSNKRVLLSAFSIGLGLLFRTSIIIAIPGILLLLNKRWQKILFIISLLPFILILLYYNYIRFNNPFENGYAIAWLSAYGKTPQTSFNIMHIPKYMIGLIFSFGKGLLFFSPSIILVFWSFKRFWTCQRKMCMSITLITITYIGFYAANFAWHGSAWNWGPRYIVAIVPLIYLSLFYIPFSKKKLIITFGIISFLVQILAISTFYKRNLVKIYMIHGDIFWNDRYFFSPFYSPIKGQVVSFLEVTRSMSSMEPKELFLPKGPWRNEDRPVSQQVMLQQSIDLNVYNFWWVRVFYITSNWWIRILTISTVTFALIILIKLTYSLWNQIERKEIGQ